MRQLLLLAGLLFGFSAPVAAATGQTAKQHLLHSLQQLSKHTGFQCDFAQRIGYADGGSQLYGGQIAVLRPARFRWHYDSPYEQLYVGDGKVIWHYEPDLMQAERMDSLDAVDPVVMQLLDGRIKAEAVTLLGFDGVSEGVGRYHVRLGQREFWLGLDDAGTLAYIESLDALGNRNRVMLTGCVFVAPDAKRFSFVPPAGVDVIDVRSGAGR
ncbi:MAG TPA: outer-membrane lipoprotein carrier protein LolA [Mariprofundaceae bacterium]|nr:outer-membrane lipoprotein carrier protein LolA [Mariprofundaceae bacterium]